MVRTHHPLLPSRPGKWLLTTGLLAMALIVFLPFSPFAAPLGFTVPNVQVLLVITVVLVLYLLTDDGLKIPFLRWIDHKANSRNKTALHQFITA